MDGDLEESRNKSAMASLIESIDHQLDAREMNKSNNDGHQLDTSEKQSTSSPTTSTFMQRPIKTELSCDNYDELNFIKSLSQHSNIDKSITGLEKYQYDTNNISIMADGDTSKHTPFNHRSSFGTTTRECANTSNDSHAGSSSAPFQTGAYSIDRFLNATELYSDEYNNGNETEWNRWQNNETNQKQNAVDAMAQKYTQVYSEAFLQNESIPEVLGLIYADQGRGLLRYSYRMWSLNRLEIDPLKEVTCRLNWSLVVPSCLQNDANEDARIKNALRKYISNHIYNCRQTIVVRENRDELNRIKALNLNKELLREAISRIVNKTSDEHGWTLYRPIPSYIMRNISGVRNKAYKQNKDLERAINDEITTTHTRSYNKGAPQFSITEGNEMSYERAIREVFVRGSTRMIRDEYRDWAVSSLAIKDWLRLDLKRIDFNRVIPKVLKTDEVIYKRIHSRLVDHIYNFVRKARFKLLIERYRHQLLWIRQKYTRENVPDQVIINFLESVSNENQWEGNIPSFLGTKSWIFKRSVDFFRLKPNCNSSTTLNKDDHENVVEETKCDDDKCSNNNDNNNDNSNTNNNNDNSNKSCDNGDPSSSYDESDAIKAAKHEMFDSNRQLRASYRRYALNKLGILSKAVEKGDKLSDDMLDYKSVLPEVLRNNEAILKKLKRALQKHIHAMKSKQRPRFVIRQKASEFAQIRRQYPTSKDCPRDRVKAIIEQVYSDQQWDNPPASIDGFISSFLYNYSIAYIRHLAESHPGQELTEEKCSEESLNDEESMSDISSSISLLTTPTPDHSGPKKTNLRRSERFHRKRSIAEDSNVDNDNNNDNINSDNTKLSLPNAKRKRTLDLAEEIDKDSPIEKVDDKNENETLNNVLKGLFERDMNGPLNSFYRKRVVDEMGITMAFSGNLEELNYERVIPEQIRTHQEIYNKVKQQIITYLIGYIRRTRLSYIAEEYAPELVGILQKYPKHNSVPLNLLYQIINRIAIKQQWKRYLPLASKLKYRIYERRELIIKRAANNIQFNQHLALQKQLLTISGNNSRDNNADSDNNNDTKIPIASATAIVNTGSLVTPTQTTITTTATTTDSPNIQSHSLFERSGNSLTSCDTEEGQTAVSSTTYALSSSLLPCSSRTVGNDSGDISQSLSDSKSGTFMESMKTKLKDLNADEMNQLMHRINEHVRNKIVTQLAAQIVQNFDVNQHDSMFNEILSIVDEHNKSL